MRIGLNSFLYASPFTNESTKLFAKFKKWGFDTVEIPVQIQGKLRGRIVVPAEADAASLQAAAAADPKIAEQLAGRTILKVVAVPGRMVNFVLANPGSQP